MAATQPKPTAICPCGYPLLPEQTCPECGRPYAAATLQRLYLREATAGRQLFAAAATGIGSSALLFGTCLLVALSRADDRTGSACREAMNQACGGLALLLLLSVVSGVLVARWTGRTHRPAKIALAAPATYLWIAAVITYLLVDRDPSDPHPVLIALYWAALALLPLLVTSVAFQLAIPRQAHPRPHWG